MPTARSSAASAAAKRASASSPAAPERRHRRPLGEGRPAARRARLPGRHSPTAGIRGPSVCTSCESSATCSGPRCCGRRGSRPRAELAGDRPHLGRNRHARQASDQELADQHGATRGADVHYMSTRHGSYNPRVWSFRRLVRGLIRRASGSCASITPLPGSIGYNDPARVGASPDIAHRYLRAHPHRSGGRHARHLAAVPLPRGAPDDQRRHQPAGARTLEPARTAASSSGRKTPAHRRGRHWRDAARRATSCGCCRCWSTSSRRRHHADHRGESPAGAGIAGSSALNVAVCAAWPVDAATLRAGGAAAGRDERRGAGDRRADRPAGLPARAVRRRVGAGARRRRRARACRSTSTRRARTPLVLCYTGAPRNSGTNNWEIMKRHIDGDRHVFDCFERIRDTAADAARGAGLRGDWDAVGARSPRSGRPQAARARRDDAGHRRLIARAAAAGATAAKVCGAGGGGCLFCFARPEPRGVARRSPTAARACSTSDRA
jgi:hypothetical protein